ncbi:hypothetical protein Tco_0129923 [Tanacetum coccineum]
MGSVSGGLDEDLINVTSGLGLVIGMIIDIGTALVGSSLALPDSAFSVLSSIVTCSPLYNTPKIKLQRKGNNGVLRQSTKIKI